MAEKLVPVPCELRLKPEVYEKIVEGSENPRSTIETWGAFFLTHYANGGMMLQPQHISAIRECSKEERITEPIQIVRLAKKALGFTDSDGLAITISLDPALAAEAKLRAEEAGFDSAKALLEHSWNTHLQDGWLYEFSPEERIPGFTESDAATAARIIGKRGIMGHDIIEWMRAHETVKE